MSDDSFSDEDVDAGDVGEGACVRVVQSSLHASIMQNSLFKVVEKQQESEDDKSDESPEISQVSAPSPIPVQGSPFNSEIFEPPITQSDDLLATTENLKTQELPKDIHIPPSFQLTSPLLNAIFNEKPKKKKKKGKNLDVNKRFYDYKAKVNQKIALLKEEKDAKESEICTFQPKSSGNPKEELKFSHFLSHMEKMKENKEKELEKLKSEKNSEECFQASQLFKPILSKKTKKLASKRHSSVDLHEKLYKEFEELKKKKQIESQAILDQLCTFKPILGKRSADLKREGLATDRLYQQSFKKKSQVFPQPERKSEKLISESSEAIVKEKFLKEFDLIFASFEQSLAWEDFLKSLEKFGFVREGENKPALEDKELAKKAWVLLQESEGENLGTDKIREFLLGVMNLNKPTGGTLKNVFVEFRKFYENRRDRTDPDSELIKPLNFAFKPEINPFSIELARIVKEKRMNSYSTDKPEKVLLLIQKSAKDKLKEEIEKRKNKGMEDCTFRPQTARGPIYTEESWTDNESLSSNYLKLLNERPNHRCDLLYTFSRVEQERKEKIMRSVEDMDIEKNMGECTFTPNLEKKIVKQQSVKEITGVKKVIEALKTKLNESQGNDSFLGATIKNLLRTDS